MTHLAVAKSINRYVKNAGIRYGDWPTWRSCWPQLAEAFDKAVCSLTPEDRCKVPLCLLGGYGCRVYAPESINKRKRRWR